MKKAGAGRSDSKAKREDEAFEASHVCNPKKVHPSGDSAEK
jgi:hypothetical protein